MSFSFLSGRTFTEVLAGFAFTSIVSPGRKGFGTFFRALCEGFFTTLIFIRPGIVQAPTAPFWTWRSMTDSSASKTSATCRLVSWRLLRDIRKHLRFRHRLGELLDSCQHSPLEMIHPPTTG